MRYPASSAHSFNLEHVVLRKWAAEGAIALVS